jgi:GR25 family glycosyltransferase involved in LPS biosynthesis
MTYNNTPLKAFVINLDEYKDNFEKQKPYLENLGLEVHRFKAINGNKDEHLQYKSYIHPLALEFTPKSAIGCTLSHILVAKHISINYNGNFSTNNTFNYYNYIMYFIYYIFIYLL